MPGFIVDGVGQGASSSGMRPMYKYAWEIENLFGSYRGDVKPIIYAKDVTMPTWEVETEDVHGASLKYKYAKTISFHDVKISWYDAAGMVEILEDWRNSVWTPDRGLALADDYKRTSNILNFSYDYGWGYRTQLVNSWPRSIKSGELTYTESDVKVVDVSVAYDWYCDDSYRSTGGRAAVNSVRPIMSEAGAQLRSGYIPDAFIPSAPAHNTAVDMGRN